MWYIACLLIGGFLGFLGGLLVGRKNRNKIERVAEAGRVLSGK